MQKRRLKFVLILICYVFLHSCTYPSCKDNKEKTSIQKAQEYVHQSEAFYTKAIEQLNIALKDTNNPQEVYFKLGKLYFEHADYDLAINNLLKVDQESAKRLLAITYFKAGQYTDALTVFNHLGEIKDDLYLYYYGRICEEHNLYDQALKLYAQVKSDDFKIKAQERIDSINAQKQDAGLGQLDPTIRELIENAPSEDEYPQAAAILLFSNEEIIVNEDNTTEYVDHYLIKVLNERGKKYAEVKAGYDSTYDKVTIELARTIRPDGTVVSVGSKHIRDVSRYLNFPLYSNARVRIVSMPEVSPGAFIEFKVRVFSSRMVAKKHLRVHYLLQGKNPIKEARFTLKLPKGRKLNLKTLNQEFNTIDANLKPDITSNETKDIYTWKLRDIPQIIPEPNMPPTVEITPVILLSTFQSWDEVFDWWWSLARDKIVINEEMKNKIRELTERKKTLLDKAKAIYNFCAKDIRYVAVEYGQAGYEPHKASDIFSNRYGDCKDQSILLISMLKEIGIESYPVLIGTRGVVKLIDDFPSLPFNHCIVVARIGEELIFLDPTGEAVSFGGLPKTDQGRKVFVFFENQGKILTTPKFSAEHNYIETKTVLKFNEDETIDASRLILTKGIFGQSQRWRFRYTMPILIKEGIKSKIQGIMPGATLIDYKIENLEDMNKEIILSYEFKGSDFLIRAGESVRIIPRLGRISLGLVSRDTRKYDINFTVPTGEKRIVEIHLPKGYILKSLPESVIKETPWFEYESSYKYQDNIIRYVERSMQKTDRIKTSDYLKYKAILERLSKNVRQSVIIEISRE